MPDFTPIESCILSVLADGQAHPRRELLACLDDSEADKRALAVHVCNIRRKLLPFGQTIVCQIGDHPISYRHVILLRGTASLPHSTA